MICYDRKIYIPQTLRRRVLDWYQLYLNHPYDSRLYKTIREVCYWKGVVIQAELYSKPCSICQQFKNRKTVYGRLPHKNIAELKLWDTVHVDLIGPYIKYIRQQHLDGAIINNNVSLSCTTMIDHATGWFEIFEVPTYDLDEVMGGNYEYIDN